jgi:hypothetical protein
MKDEGELLLVASRRSPHAPAHARALRHVRLAGGSNPQTLCWAATAAPGAECSRTLRPGWPPPVGRTRGEQNGAAAWLTCSACRRRKASGGKTTCFSSTE